MKRTIYLGLALCFGGLFLVPLGFLVWIVATPFDKSRVAMLQISRLWSFFLIDLNPLWSVKIEGLENIDRSKSYVIISNHQTMLDIPLLHNLPINFVWVAKRELFRSPIVGWVLWMQDSINLKRGDAQSGRDMITKGTKILKNKMSIMIFPEGTRSKTGRVNDFLPGAFLLASKVQCPILPVMINGTYTVHKWREVFTVKVLPEIPAEQVASTKIKVLSAQLNELIRQEHKQVAPELYQD